MTNAPKKVLDASGNPVCLTYFHILEMPDYSESATGVLGGEEVPLLDFNEDGSWSTPNGRVRAKDVWDVRPADGQGAFQLLTPWSAKVLIVDAPPDLQVAKVIGWDGTSWLTDRGRARHVEGPVPIERTLDDDWTF